VELEILGEADQELHELPAREGQAMINALEKLRQLGIDLDWPHSSQVRGSRLRELRPRQGRSPWRAFYTRSGDLMVVGAIGPEAQHDQRGFDRAVRIAEERIETFQRRP
jgi:phage-related protein